MKLAEWLDVSNTTDAELAHRIGTSVISVRRYLNGTRKPASVVMRKIHSVTDGEVTANDFWLLTHQADQQHTVVAA